MTRVAPRLRLALGFTVALAVVLVLFGWLLHTRLGDSLLAQLDDHLEARRDLALASGPTLHPDNLAAGDRETVAQLVARDGFLLASSFFASAALPVVIDGPTHQRVAAVAALDNEPARILVTPLADGRTLLVGASLADRDEALRGLVVQLLILAPLVLILAALGAYALAARALRPVEELIGRLERGLARERRLVADASHELRTPLAAVKAEVELALRRERAPAELVAALRSVGDEVDRLTTLADDLLVLAQSDDGVLALRVEQLDARELAAAVVARAAGGDRDIVIDGPDPAPVEVDRRRAERAIANLVANALLHGAGTVVISIRNNDNAVSVRVADDGPGIPAELRDHAFERFTRADAARSGGGAGLGLAIAAAIVRAHGGEAVIEDGWVVLRFPRRSA